MQKVEIFRTRNGRQSQGPDMQKCRESPYGRSDGVFFIGSIDNFVQLVPVSGVCDARVTSANPGSVNVSLNSMPYAITLCAGSTRREGCIGEGPLTFFVRTSWSTKLNEDRRIFRRGRGDCRHIDGNELTSMYIVAGRIDDVCGRCHERCLFRLNRLEQPLRAFVCFPCPIAEAVPSSRP